MIEGRGAVTVHQTWCGVSAPLSGSAKELERFIHLLKHIISIGLLLGFCYCERSCCEHSCTSLPRTCTKGSLGHILQVELLNYRVCACLTFTRQSQIDFQRACLFSTLRSSVGEFPLFPTQTATSFFCLTSRCKIGILIVPEFAFL